VGNTFSVLQESCVTTFWLPDHPQFKHTGVLSTSPPCSISKAPSCCLSHREMKRRREWKPAGDELFTGQTVNAGGNGKMVEAFCSLELMSLEKLGRLSRILPCHLLCTTFHPFTMPRWMRRIWGLV